VVFIISLKHYLI